ncbi:hypothetical protein RRG08_058690 [Elysia crispata]|uniref:Uncharacterized protein n=1 Tax=Elysia crispata TaxID=231223 RepID=A0AAE0YWK7_9GAST|nr:hypothetical protein RRG08_058690 [Elysia crispata]
MLASTLGPTWLYRRSRARNPSITHLSGAVTSALSPDHQCWLELDAHPRDSSGVRRQPNTINLSSIFPYLKPPAELHSPCPGNGEVKRLKLESSHQNTLRSKERPSLVEQVYQAVFWGRRSICGTAVKHLPRHLQGFYLERPFAKSGASTKFLSLKTKLNQFLKTATLTHLKQVKHTDVEEKAQKSPLSSALDMQMDRAISVTSVVEHHLVKPFIGHRVGRRQDEGRGSSESL